MATTSIHSFFVLFSFSFEEREREHWVEYFLLVLFLLQYTSNACILSLLQIMTDQVGVAYGVALSIRWTFSLEVEIYSNVLILVLGGLLGYFRGGSLISLLLGNQTNSLLAGQIFSFIHIYRCYFGCLVYL